MFRQHIINPIRRYCGLPVHYRMKAKGAFIGTRPSFWTQLKAALKQPA